MLIKPYFVDTSYIDNDQLVPESFITKTKIILIEWPIPEPFLAFLAKPTPEKTSLAFLAVVKQGRGQLKKYSEK